MDLSAWFQTQLQAGGQGFAWAVAQVPPERQMRTPPPGLGEWSAARHAFHLLFYERELALPSMRAWLGQPFDRAELPDEDVAWDARAAVPDLLAQFEQVRAAQLEVLRGLPAGVWEAPRMAVWGEVPLRWVMTKTFQHTAEHTHNVLSLALYWDVVGGQPRRR
jgi:hypothetical protein